MIKSNFYCMFQQDLEDFKSYAFAQRLIINFEKDFTRLSENCYCMSTVLLRLQGGAKVAGQRIQLIVMLLLVRAQFFWSQNIPNPLV